MHRGLPCSKEMLEPTKLHDVIPQAPLQRCPPHAEKTPMTMLPTCDEDLINEFKQDLI
jgi:hypothetical protein